MSAPQSAAARPAGPSLAPASAAAVLGYDYLARAWLDGPLRPEEAVLRVWLADLVQVDAVLAKRWAEVVRLLDLPAERRSAQEDFDRCLVIPQPGSYVPPYASVWLDGADGLWGPTTARILRYYQDGGLDWAGGQAPGQGRAWVQAPDHLGVECAFVAELMAGAVESGTDPFALAAGFLSGHLVRWVPAYADELARHVRSPYWRGLAGVLVTWVKRCAPPDRS